MRKCLKKGFIVAMAVSRTASVKTLSRFAKDLLEEMGSEEISKLDYGQSWAFVGVFGEKNRIESRKKEGPATVAKNVAKFVDDKIYIEMPSISLKEFD